MKNHGSVLSIDVKGAPKFISESFPQLMVGETAYRRLPSGVVVVVSCLRYTIASTKKGSK